MLLRLKNTAVFGFLLVLVFPFYAQVRLDFMSSPPPPLPAYPGFWRSHDVEGNIIVSVTFQGDGTTESVHLESSAFSGRWDDSWGSLEDEALRLVSRQIMQWKSLVRPVPPRRITVHYRLDDSLSERQRNYLLRYDEYGIISNIEISSPRIKN